LIRRIQDVLTVNVSATAALDCPASQAARTRWRKSIE